MQNGCVSQVKIYKFQSNRKRKKTKSDDKI